MTLIIKYQINQKMLALAYLDPVKGCSKYKFTKHQNLIFRNTYIDTTYCKVIVIRS